MTGRVAPWIVGTAAAAVMLQVLGAPSARMRRLTSSLFANWEYRSVRPARFTYCGGAELSVPAIPGADLPVIALSGRANTATEAISAVDYGRRALVEYVQRQQQEAKIPTDQRIHLQIVQRATKPVVVGPRKKTLAIVVFLAVLVATIGLAFILENLRPRVRAVAPAAPAFRADTKQTA